MTYQYKYSKCTLLIEIKQLYKGTECTIQLSVALEEGKLTRQYK